MNETILQSMLPHTREVGSTAKTMCQKLNSLDMVNPFDQNKPLKLIQFGPGTSHYLNRLWAGMFLLGQKPKPTGIHCQICIQNNQKVLTNCIFKTESWMWARLNNIFQSHLVFQWKNWQISSGRWTVVIYRCISRKLDTWTDKKNNSMCLHKLLFSSVWPRFHSLQ